MDPKHFPIYVVWVDVSTWSVRCGFTGQEIMKFTVFGLKQHEVRAKVEQFLESTQYDGRRVWITPDAPVVE